MATTAYDYDNSALTWLGQYADFTWQSQLARQIRGNNSELRFKATGTDLTVRMLVASTGTNYIQASIDGGAFSNLSMSGLTINTWSDVDVFTGLSDAEHEVILRLNTGTATNVFYQQSSTLSLTGAAPAIALADNCGPTYGASIFPLSSVGAIEGGCGSLSQGGNTYPQNLTLPWPDCRIRFTGNPTAISIWAMQNGCKYAVLQDGTSVGTLTLTTGSAYGLQTIVTGLSGTHEYEIINVGTSPAVLGQIQQVVLAGGDITGSDPDPRPAIVGYGDSKVAGNGGGSGGDSSQSWLSMLCRSKNYEAWNRGVSGQRVLEHATTAVGAGNRWHDCVPFNTPEGAPRYIIVQVGHNDASNSSDITAFEASFTQMLLGLQTACPDAEILVTSIFPTTAFNSMVRGNYNTAIEAAVTAVNDAQVQYIDTDDWIEPATDTTDGTHPNPTGSAKIVTELEAYIDDYVAPSSGTVPDASDVRSGVEVGETTGTLVIPAASDVQTGVGYGAAGTEFTGTFTAPDAGDVRASETYGGGGTEFTGTLTLPAVGDVQEAVTYGAGGDEYTGTFAVPAAEDVAIGVQYGASGTEFTGTLSAGGGEADWTDEEKEQIRYRLGLDGTATAPSAASPFPANFASLAINASGHIERVTLVDTTTANTDMRGTDSAYTGTPPTVESISTRVASDLASAHGSGSWETATGFATPTNVTDAQAAIIVHGDGDGAWGMAGGDIDGYTLEQAMRIVLAALAGKLSGAGTNTITIKAADDSKTRITATVTEDENRTALTLDAD